MSCFSLLMKTRVTPIEGWHHIETRTTTFGNNSQKHLTLAFPQSKEVCLDSPFTNSLSTWFKNKTVYKNNRHISKVPSRARCLPFEELRNLVVCFESRTKVRFRQTRLEISTPVGTRIFNISDTGNRCQKQLSLRQRVVRVLGFFRPDRGHSFKLFSTFQQYSSRENQNAPYVPDIEKVCKERPCYECDRVCEFKTFAWGFRRV